MVVPACVLAQASSGNAAEQAAAAAHAAMIAGTTSVPSGTVHYYYTDPQGTVLAETDANGNITATFDYAPYGTQAMGTVPDGPGYTGHVNDRDTGLVYMQARYYDPIGRMLSVDPTGPVAGNIYGFNRYVYANNNPIVNIDPDGRDAIPVVFPDYKITTPIGKIGGLGHAGIILIDNKTGHTRYFEYGRYDKANLGIVRTRQVPNVTIGKNGSPTADSLKKLLNAVSRVAGDGGRVEGTYVKNDNYKEMLQYATSKMNQNSDPSREKYSLTSNNCTTFCKTTLESGGEHTPSMIDPRPNSYINELQDTLGSPVNYDPSKNSLSCGSNGNDCAQFK